MRKHHCNSQRTSYSLFDVMDFYKNIYIVYVLFFYIFYKICAMMNIADCKLQYNNNIMHN